MTRPDFPRCLHVAVLYGGSSDEREISIASGREVAAALQAREHRVTLIDPAVVDLNVTPLDEFDVAFNALHGAYGEDGQLQELLELRGLKYTGSGPAASRLAFGKWRAKQEFTRAGIGTPAGVLMHQTDSLDVITQQAESIGYPVIVKPDEQGSSLGISIVKSPDCLGDAVQAAFRYGPNVICEQYIAGTEWTVPVVDDDLLPVICIETDVPFFDFDAKYQSSTTRYRFDVELPRPILSAIEQAGLGACQSLGTQGIARVDIRLDDQLQPWVLEVNTSPGMTDHSLVPKAAARLGLDLGQLCEVTIRRALGEVLPLLPDRG